MFIKDQFLIKTKERALNPPSEPDQGLNQFLSTPLYRMYREIIDKKVSECSKLMQGQ